MRIRRRTTLLLRPASPRAFLRSFNTVRRGPALALSKSTGPLAILLPPLPPPPSPLPETNEDKGKTDVRGIKTDLAVAKQMLSDMEHTNRNIPEPTKRDVSKKISVHREALKTLEKDLAQAEQKFDRGALFGSRSGAGGPLEYDKSQSARDRATAATEKLKTGTNVLEDAHRRVEETIDVGADTLGQLESNREKMLRIRGNVRGRKAPPPPPPNRHPHSFPTSGAHPPPSLSFPLTAGGGCAWGAGHCTDHPARHEQAGNTEQGCSGCVCGCDDWHYCAGHLVCN